MCCLELVLLIILCRYLTRTAATKGHAGWPYAVLMVATWFVIGFVGAVIGYLAEGMPDTQVSVGGFIGYAVGAAIASVGVSSLVNLLPDRANAHERAAVNEQEAYIEWRKRQGAKKAQLAEDEDEPIVELEPADAPPPPRAGRAWTRRNWDAD